MKCLPVAFPVISLVVALLCLGVQTRGQAAKPNGLIVGVDGDWLLDPDAYVETGTQAKPQGGSRPKETQPPPPLRFLQPVNVRPDTCAYGTNGHLAIQMGTAVSSVVCEEGDHGNCSRHFAPINNKPVVCSRQIAPQPAAGKSILNFLAWLFEEEPEHYVTPVSRGLGPELSDAVVELQGGSVDLAPLFVEMDSGSYRVRLEAVDAPGKALINTVVNWKVGGRAGVAIAGLKPGLYRVVQVDPNGGAVEQDAWALASPPERFEKQSAQFREAVAATKNWPAEVDARAPRAVLRACLDALSGAQNQERAK